MKSKKGFIQIPVVAFLSVGIITILATGYYFVIAKNNKQTEAVKTVVSNISVLEESKTVTSTESVKIKEVKAITKEQVTASASSSTQKADGLANAVIIDLGLSQLDDQISSFSRLLDAIGTTKKNYISYSQSSNQTRADLLNDFANIVSDNGIKSFAQKSAAEFAGYSQSSQSDYEELYEPVETELNKQIEMSSNIKETISRGYVPNLSNIISLGSQEMERFLNLAEKLNDAGKSFEQQKADSFSQALKYLDNLVAISSISSSVSQQLSQIEQQAQQILAPKKAIQCWADTKYSGGIVNGTSQTSIRCE